MDHIFEQYKRTGYLHHAHIVEGMYEMVLPALLSALSINLGIDVKNNPDLTIQNYESFGVDEARLLKTAQTRASFSNELKIFIVGAEVFTHEAQNALLKTFEEPTEGTHFFIIIPRSEALLPTLLSRVLVSSGDENIVRMANGLGEQFLNAEVDERFAMIKKMADKKERETADRELFRRMLDDIERILYTRQVSNGNKTTINIFREIFQAKTYLADRGSSPKMLLEHLAMILPSK